MQERLCEEVGVVWNWIHPGYKSGRGFVTTQKRVVNNTERLGGGDHAEAGSALSKKPTL